MPVAPPSPQRNGQAIGPNAISTAPVRAVVGPSPVRPRRGFDGLRALFWRLAERMRSSLDSIESRPTKEGVPGSTPCQSAGLRTPSPRRGRRKIHRFDSLELLGFIGWFSPVAPLPSGSHASLRPDVVSGHGPGPARVRRCLHSGCGTRPKHLRPCPLLTSRARRCYPVLALSSASSPPIGTSSKRSAIAASRGK